MKAPDKIYVEVCEDGIFAFPEPPFKESVEYIRADLVGQSLQQEQPIEEIEYLKYASKVDPVDIMIIAKEAQKFIDNGQIEDALAYAIAAGVRLGIKAILEQ